MSEYSNFPKDFLIRTRENLDKYSGDFEVTNLINNCLGLIIIPKQFFENNLPDYVFNDSVDKYGISKTNIKHEKNNNYMLNNVIRHIRNGLAHGRIEQKSSSGEICGVRIFDCDQGTSCENFSIELTVEELKTFALKLSDDFVN